MGIHVKHRFLIRLSFIYIFIELTNNWLNDRDFYDKYTENFMVNFSTAAQ